MATPVVRLPFADVDDEMGLSQSQLFRLCAECLVLCLPVELSELSAKDEGALRLGAGLRPLGVSDAA